MRASVGASLVILMHLEVHAIAEPSPEKLYQEGQASYSKGAYAAAIAKWQQAYAISRAPALLFNLAQAYRLHGDCRDALSSYRKFVELAPQSEERSLADDFMTELHAKCGAPSVKPGNARGQPMRTIEIAGLATGGGGIVLVVTGLLFGSRASSIGDEVTSTCERVCDWGMQKSKHARGQRYETIGYAFDAVGLIAVVGGVTMYYLGRKRSLDVATMTDGAVVSWSGSW